MLADKAVEFCVDADIPGNKFLYSREIFHSI